MPLIAKVIEEEVPPLPVAPSEEAWRAMTPAQRQAFVEETLSAIDDQADFMSEGRPHAHAKNKATDKLERYFQRIGRRIYLANELPVIYPGERAITPDLMAVLDVDDPGEADERTAWIVADERKGLDLVLEVYFSGNEKKDFVDNVEGYARRGIKEYFIYDRRRQALHGYRLPSAGATRYQKMRLRFGRLSSVVLGLDLLIHAGRLRFYSGDAELPDSAELIARIEVMVDDLQQRREVAEARAEQILDQLRATVLGVVNARGLGPSERLQEHVAACEDSATLCRWITRAATAASLEEVLIDA